MARKKVKQSKPMPDFRSGFERQIRAYLLKLGIPFEYESRKYRLTLPVVNHSCKDCGSKQIQRWVSYTPDWVLTAKDIVVESKGKFTARDRKLALAMQMQYPLEKYKMAFQRDNWISGKKKQRYSDWCERNEIDYHIGHDFPKEWWA